MTDQPPETHLVDDVELTHRQRRLVLRVIAVNCILTIILFLVVGMSAYRSNRDDTISKRAGCERNKLDRAANATGWRTAEVRLQAQYERDPQPSDLKALRKYNRIATGLEKRSRINCAKQFPDQPFVKIALLP
jgi:hypothetical protein